MESRKYQLLKQIIEAQKSNDKELFALLKTQWAHRFGVESLEELNNLDLNQANDDSSENDNQKHDESEDDLTEHDKNISMKDDLDVIDNEEKQLLNDQQNGVEFFDSNNIDSCESKSYVISVKEKYDNKTTDLVPEIKNVPQVQPLIPLPPKPKYSYLKKWLRSKF